jgi:hypothetical protein
VLATAGAGVVELELRWLSWINLSGGGWEWTSQSWLRAIVCETEKSGLGAISVGPKRTVAWVCGSLSAVSFTLCEVVGGSAAGRYSCELSAVSSAFG